MKRIALLLLMAALLVSCASTSRTTGPATDLAEGTRTASAPEPDIRLKLADARDDILGVFTAMHAQLQNPDEPLTGPVLFATAPLIDDPEPQMAAFGLADVMLETDDQIADNPLHRRLDGIMRLADPAGREAYWACAAEYIVQDEGILILSSAMMPLLGRFDQMRLFFVPPEQLPALQYLQDIGQVELLKIAASNALKPDELHSQNAVRELLLFVIDMTRSDPHSRLALYTDGSIADAAVRSSTSHNRDGWRSLMIEGSFRFGSETDYRLLIAEESDAYPEPRVLAEVEPGNP